MKLGLKLKDIVQWTHNEFPFDARYCAQNFWKIEYTRKTFGAKCTILQSLNSRTFQNGKGQFLTHIFGPWYCFFMFCVRELSGNLSVSSLAWNQVDCHKHLSFCWMASASPLWELTSFSQCQHQSILFELPIDDHLWELVRGKIQLDDAHSNVESSRFLKISDDEVSQSQRW